MENGKFSLVIGLVLSLCALGVLSYGFFTTSSTKGFTDGTHFSKVTANNGLQVTSGGATTDAGGLVVTAGGVTVSDGDTRVSSLLQVGTIATFTASSTATTANVCNQPTWTVTPASTTPTITLPTAVDLAADCLTADGDQRIFTISNLSSATSTILAAGSGGTLKWSLASSTINAGVDSVVVLKRMSATTYRAAVLLQPN